MSGTLLLRLDSDWLYWGQARLDNRARVVIPRGVTAVVGPNGAGKSMLGDIIARGRNFRTNRIVPCAGNGHDIDVRKVEFSDVHSLRGITGGAGYYQQRYEATMNDDVPTVGDVIARTPDPAGVMRRCRLMGLTDEFMARRINYLSSGELRKLLVANALTGKPDLLILDNPYIGLDTDSRSVLDEALTAIATDGVSVMLIVCDPRDIPPYADAVVPVADMALRPAVPVTGDVDVVRRAMKHLFDYAVDTSRLPRPLRVDNEPLDVIAAFNGCRVSYGNRTIIDRVDWIIRDNERWALTGPNGSGKSTLLSMINADNPAAYRQDITLFDRRRGTGESIWDIKSRIGYVSPEMRLYFSGTGSALTVIGQGLIDTVGNYVRLRPDQVEQARIWVRLLHLEPIADRPFNTLSAGERQMVLFARALIKQPRLLILDEPMHGLDYGRKRALRALVNHLAARADLEGSPYPVSMIYVTHRPDEMPECITLTKALQ